MHLTDALAIVEAGGRITSSSIPKGSVVKQVHNGWKPVVRVVFEATGDSYLFQNSNFDQSVDWREVEGWASYD